jgi:hypothetical protein
MNWALTSTDARVGVQERFRIAHDEAFGHFVDVGMALA